MSFAEFVSKYCPTERPRLPVKLRRKKPKGKRPTKSGFHIGEVVLTRYWGQQTIRSIRRDTWGYSGYRLYFDHFVTANASEVERID